MTETELIEWGLNPNYINPEFLNVLECSPTFPSRFVKRVKKTDGCWLWPQGKKYGVIGRGGYRSGMVGAHVASYILHHGPVPKTVDVCHKCDNPRCVNPEHLFLGTRKDNMQDCSKKGRIRGINSERKRLGELAPNSKFTNEQVLRIISLRKDGLKYTEIAPLIPCSPSAVALICQGRVWSHLTGIPRPIGKRREIKRFTLQEKGKIEILFGQGFGPRKISKILNRNYGSIHTYLKSLVLRNLSQC